MKIKLSDEITFDSIVDGTGLRAVVWFQGCYHNCLGCHNPETHDVNGGNNYLVDEVIEKLKNNQLQDGITFTGGEPLLQIRAALEIAKAFPLTNIWLYTGYRYEEVIKMAQNNAALAELLSYIDVMVDGKFDINQKSLAKKFCGSINQRVIDVNQSLEQQKIVELDFDFASLEQLEMGRVYI